MASNPPTIHKTIRTDRFILLPGFRLILSQSHLRGPTFLKKKGLHEIIAQPFVVPYLGRGGLRFR
jgi:hypothetical protein